VLPIRDRRRCPTLRLVKLVALTVVAAALVAATPAGADRAPTQTERSAIARAAGIQADCAAIRISTVRHRHKWAAVRTRARCLRPREIAVQQIFRRKRVRGAPWRQRWARPDGCEALYERVPDRVLDDFRIGCAIG
jgi:hypothetical protein